MPRFFFHLRDPHKRLTDCEGTLLGDAAAACRLATLTARDFFRPASNCIDAGYEDGSIEVSDERGRIIFGLAIADAPGFYEGDACLPGRQDMSHSVVYLDIERAKREFAALAAGLRALLGRTSRLADHNRYECKNLYHLMQETEAVRARSQALLARSRQQASAGDAWGARATG
jgi:hypothetical protein